jgi:nucleoside-diphosphate-sugar epimerase
MSKAFAEELICNYSFKLPVAIVRPSIIVGAFNEPQPGFVQGLQVKYFVQILSIEFLLVF